MTIRLYNTLTRQKDALVPGDPNRVTMYVCGPTVYSPRPYRQCPPGGGVRRAAPAAAPRLWRASMWSMPATSPISMTASSPKAPTTGVPISEITRRTEDWYLDDMGALGVEPPDIAPHATTSIPAMMAMIEQLIAKGHAYAAQGHVLFDVPSFAGYGALSRRPLDEMIAGARVEVAPYKKSPADFVLWKPSHRRPARLGLALGPRPAGLAHRMLGDDRGDRSAPPSTSMAAARTCNSRTTRMSWRNRPARMMARRWPASGCTTASSTWAAATRCRSRWATSAPCRELLAEGWSGEVLRLALLSAHYRQPLEWTESLLEQMKTLLNRWQGRSAAPGAGAGRGGGSAGR